MTFKEFCKELLEEYGYIIFQYDSVISFTQTFPDTTCGLGGIGGQAFTDAQIFIFVDQSNRNAIVIDPKSETIRSEDGYYIGTAHKFKFEGHDYISFTKGHGVAVVHNPKCHCNLNEDY